MQYLNKRCPKCDFLLEHSTNTTWEFGSPLIKCPKCGTISIDEKRKEVYMLTSWDYFAYFAFKLISVILISFIISLFFYGLFVEILKTTTKASIILGIISFLAFLIFFSIRSINNFKNEKEKSLKRLEESNYYETLKKLDLLEYEKENYKDSVKEGKNENMFFVILLFIIILIIAIVALIVKK